MQVFIVTSGGDYELRIRAVFSDEAEANKHLTRLRQEGSGYELEVRAWTVQDAAPKFAIHSATYDFAPGVDHFEQVPVLTLNAAAGFGDTLPEANAHQDHLSKHIVGIGYGASEWEAKDNLWAAIDAHAEHLAES